MPLASGARLGSYEIVAPLGAGGMGEVYRARDTKLHRDVAVKVLPELFAADPDRLSRFQREAHLLASLNHPNIAAIYGFEEGQTSALVLELVEGPTLAERLQHGPLPVDDALPVARQIAEALEAAHARGIIHRDLKPANVKVRPDGTVKVLDFGLAKALDSAIVSDAAASPTRTSPAMITHAGVVLGTAAYMAPEQAKGREVDSRADVWAFGCVLFEMLAGASPFGGETVSEMLASVLKVEPDWRLLPSDTPEGIRRLLRRCLRKDPGRRLQHIGDARIEIDETQSGPAVADRDVRIGSPGNARVAWIAAGVLAVTAATLGVLLSRPAQSADEVRLEITTPPTTDPLSLAISPDGRRIVYVATTAGRTQLWLRELDSASARALPGTDAALLPFWSPDSRSIGFFADAKLKRMSIESGAVHVLANAQTPAGGTWNQDDTILFCPNISGNVHRIAAGGGQVQPALPREEGRQLTVRYPQFLPDGRHFIYSVATGSESGIYVANLDGSVTTRLLDADSPAVYGSGHLLFIRQGTLFAQPFDADRLTLSGSPIRVAEGVPADRFGAPLSAAAAGPIIYRAGSIPSPRQFVWVDRSGKELEKVGEPDDANPLSPVMSAEGRVAMHRIVDGNTDIWWFDMRRRVLERFTTHPDNDIHPIWSPDGSRMLYVSLRGRVYDLYQGSIIQTAEHELVLATPHTKRPMDWSPDGRFVLFRSNHPTTGPDIWALSMAGDRKTIAIVQTEFEERDAQFSPDAKWIVYESNKSGRPEIVVRPFLGPGGDLQISVSGGSQARWGRDGREIYYLALDGRLMAVPVRITSDGQTLEAAAPVPLFTASVGPVLQRLSGPQYMVAADGKRFLLNRLTEQTYTSPITVILNWKPKT